jgi:hypothetical protein
MFIRAKRLVISRLSECWLAKVPRPRRLIVERIGRIEESKRVEPCQVGVWDPFLLEENLETLAESFGVNKGF